MKKIKDEKLQKKIGFKPLPWQKEVLKCDNKEMLLCCGRRSGKTFLVSYMGFKQLLYPNQVVWIVAPNYLLTEIVFNNIVKWTAKLFNSNEYKVVNKPTKKLTLQNGSVLECKSVEAAAGMLGHSTDLIIVDEAARVPSEIWTQYLEPTTQDRNGKVVFISTPTGMNWFYDKYLDLKKKGAGFHYPSSVNKTIFTKEKWEQLKKEKTQKDFEEWYEAKFISNSGQVFRGLDDVIEDYKEVPPEEGKGYIIGVDIAKHEDYTVLMVMDRTNYKVVYMDRFKEIDYNLQKERIITLARKYNNAKVIMDETGCLIDKQKIITEKGFKDVSNLKIGNRVLTDKNNYKKIERINNKRDIAEIYSITPAYQTIPVQLSFNHPVLTENGWIEAGQLDEGNLLKIKTKIPKKKFDYSCFKNKKLYHPNQDRFKDDKFYKRNEFWRTVGYYLAEGWTRTKRRANGKRFNHISFGFHIKELEYHQDIREFAGIIGRSMMEKEKPEKNCKELTISCGWLSRWFNIFGDRAHKKKIPSEFDNLPDKFLKEIIKGFWRGDGDVMTGKKGFRLHSASIDLIMTMQRWLLHFGIISSLTKSDRKPRTKYVLNIYGEEGIKFGKIIGEQHYKIKKKNPKAGFIKNGFLYSPIKTITTENKKSRLWEFEVKDDNTARANGLVLHNTGDPVVQDIRRHIYIEGYRMYSNKAKEQLIDKLSIFIEQKIITIPNIPVLIDELRRYGYKKSESGKTKYSAPNHRHDDTVIALALCVWGILNPNKKKEEVEPQKVILHNQYL